LQRSDITKEIKMTNKEAESIQKRKSTYTLAEENQKNYFTIIFIVVFLAIDLLLLLFWFIWYFKSFAEFTHL
jgi:hypothetical protein